MDEINWSPSGTSLLVVSQQSECCWVFDLSCDSPIARIEGSVTKSCWGDDDVRIWTDVVRALQRTNPH